MPIPFIAGAIVGIAGITLYNKRENIKQALVDFKSEDFAKSAGKSVENAILKVSNIKMPCMCEKASKKSCKKESKDNVK